MNSKLLIRKFIAFISPKLLLSLDNFHHFHSFIHWRNPRDWNEKQCWLSFNTDTTKWSELADKYLVRSYIEKKGYPNLLVKLYGVWDKAEDINFSDLPNSFVLKTNHGSATNILVKDKSKLDIPSTVNQLNGWLKTVFGWPCEPHYKRIHPRIIAEEYLTQDGNISNSLIDYKVFVGGGEICCILVCYDRTTNEVKLDCKDSEWNDLSSTLRLFGHFKKSDKNIPKPKNLKYMLEVAKDLADGFPEVRVDFYEVKGKLFFGEMTFTSCGLMSYFTHEQLLKMGSKVPIPKKIKLC